MENDCYTFVNSSFNINFILYNKDLFHRDTVITIVTSLPLGIFKDESKKQIVKEKEQINIRKMKIILKLDK